MTVDQPISVSVQVDGAGDEVQIVGARVWIMPTE